MASQAAVGTAKRAEGFPCGTQRDLGGDRFGRSAQRARCLCVLGERGASLRRRAPASTDLALEEADASSLLGADMIFTSVAGAGPGVAIAQALAAQREDLHYAPLEVQRLMENGEYVRAISSACQQMMGVGNAEPSAPGLAIARPCRQEDASGLPVLEERSPEDEAESDSAVRQLVDRGATLCHIYVVGNRCFVVEGTCLPRLHNGMSHDDLDAAVAELVCGFDRAGGHIVYESVRRCAAEAAVELPPKRLRRLQEGDDGVRALAPRLEQLASILQEALGIGMFGFDVLLGDSSAETFHLVGLSLLPPEPLGIAEDLPAAMASHLFDECQQRAVRADICGAVNDPRQTVDLVVSQHPEWRQVDGDTVGVQVLSASTRGDKTGLVVGLTAPGKSPLICRLRGVIERTAFEKAIADEMMGTPGVPLVGSYFGSQVLVGYTEPMVRGVQLEKVVVEVNRRRLCRHLGAALRTVHEKGVEAQSPDFLGVPLCVSRMRSNAIIAWEAIRHVEELRPQFCEIFPAVLSYDIANLPVEARVEVFGHFDINLTNVLVDLAAPPEEAPRVHFIDWEQAGPNVAAYDFGKFLVSYAIAVTVSDDELQSMVDNLTEGYAPEWSRAAKRRFKTGVLAMMPYVAALNFMSNVRHASTEDGARWVTRGAMHHRAWRRYRSAWESVVHEAGAPSLASLGEASSERTSTRLDGLQVEACEAR